MNKLIILSLLFGSIFGIIVGIGCTYQYMIGNNFYQIHHTDSGDFILKGTKIYDISELKVQGFGNVK
jgi:uncharacterized membrane protein YedE/YeeE